MERRDFLYLAVIAVLLIFVFLLSQQNQLKAQADTQPNDPFTALDYNDIANPAVTTNVEVTPEGEYVLSNRESQVGELEVFVYDASFPEKRLRYGISSRLMDAQGNQNNFVSDDDGVLFYSANPGIYSLEILGNDLYGTNHYQGKIIPAIEIKANETTHLDVDVEFFKGVFEVTVTDASGNPLPAIEVHITDIGNEHVLLKKTSDASGKASFPISVGTYGIEINEPSYPHYFRQAWDVVAGQTTSFTVQFG